MRTKNALFIPIAGKETQLCLKHNKPTRVATTSLTFQKITNFVSPLHVFFLLARD